MARQLFLAEYPAEIVLIAQLPFIINRIIGFDKMCKSASIYKNLWKSQYIINPTKYFLPGQAQSQSN